MPELVTIAAFDDLPSAYIARSRLEDEGIPCFLANEHLVAVNWLYSQAVGGVELRVPQSEAQAAREILENLEPGQAENGTPANAPEDICPKCRSAEVEARSLGRPLAALSYLFFPIPLTVRWRRCRACGHRWK